MGEALGTGKEKHQPCEGDISFYRRDAEIAEISSAFRFSNFNRTLHH